MDQTESNAAPGIEATIVAVCQRLEGGRRLAGLLGGSPRPPEPRQGMTMLWSVDGNGTRRLAHAREGQIPGGNDPWAVFIRSEPPVACEFGMPLAKRDSEGHEWDLSLRVQLKVEDARSLANEFALPLISPQAPLSEKDLVQWLWTRIEHRVCDAIASYSVEQLREERAVSVPAWEQALSQWLQPLGLSVTVREFALSSASAAAADQRRREAADAKAIQEHQQRARELEVNAARADTTLEMQRALIEADKKLAEADRRAALEDVEHTQTPAAGDSKRQQVEQELAVSGLRHQALSERLQRQREADAAFAERRRKAQLEEEAKLTKLQELREQVRRDATLRAAERDAKLAELKHQEEQARRESLQRDVEFQLRQKEGELRVQALQAAHDQATALAARQTEILEAQAAEAKAASDEARQQARERHQLQMKILEQELRSKDALLERLASQLADLSADTGRILHAFAAAGGANGGNGPAYHQAMEVLAHDAKAAPERLAPMGFSVTAQALIDRWTRKAHADGQPVTFVKREMHTRDVGLGVANVLSIGSRLDFTFSSRRGGCLTLLNLGTSGRFWLSCPGMLCPVAQATVAPGRSYSIPGPELFGYGHEFREKGPPGWEHMVAIVSDSPLFDGATAGDPVVEVSGARLEAIDQRLQQAPGTWTVGVLSFLVE